MTGMMGVSWLFYIMSKGHDIEFLNSSIQYQMPLLIIVSIIKYLIVLLNRFKVRRRMFYVNVVCYVVFFISIVFIDYRDSILISLNVIFDSARVLIMKRFFKSYSLSLSYCLKIYLQFFYKRGIR